MSTPARRLARLETALPEQGLEAMLRHLAARNGLSSAELETFRRDVYQAAGAFARLTREESIDRLAAETGEDQKTIRAELTELEAVYRESEGRSCMLTTE